MKLWIVRDLDGTLGLMDGDKKPKPILGEWMSNKNYYSIDKRLFPEVTYENSPQEIELKLVPEIIGVVESPSKTFPRTNEFEVGASYRR